MKKIIRQLHLWLGLLTGIVVFLVSITGCIYVFEQEIRNATQAEYLYVPHQNQPFIGLELIENNFHKIEPKSKIRAVKIFEGNENSTVRITTDEQKNYYFNPYTGDLVNKTNQDWLSTVEHLHRTLLLEDFGKQIMHWSIVIYMFMLISGVILWFPSQVRLLKQAFTIKWNASFKRLNYDLHNVLGFYSLFFLIVIASTGLYFAFKEVKTFVSFATQSKLSKGDLAAKSTKIFKNGEPFSYAKFYNFAKSQVPTGLETTISTKGKDEIRLRILYPSKWSRLQNTFFFDSKTGELLRTKLYKNNTQADIFEASNYNLHTGQMFGLLGKLIAFIVSLVSASLPITGFMIWWKKRCKRDKKNYRVSTY